MITWHDLYMVLTAVVPLYMAMILAYGSIRWWRIFSLDQCSGINWFVAIFAVPLLSFHFISTNNPYAMNFRFIAADTLQKLIVLAAWARLPRLGHHGLLPCHPPQHPRHGNSPPHRRVQYEGGASSSSREGPLGSQNGGAPVLGRNRGVGPPCTPWGPGIGGRGAGPSRTP